MPLTIGPRPPALSDELLEKVRRVSFPTIGHHLEEGFVDPQIERQTGTDRVIGRAVTVRLTAQDSVLLHHAVGQIEPGDVLVIDTGGDRRHAPVGEMIAVGTVSRGGVGIIVDGVITDVEEIEREGLPVYSRGRSVLTTKFLSLANGGMNVPVTCGGVSVAPGDLVVADRNGVLVLAPDVAAAVIDRALADDAAEPAEAVEVRAGRPLGEVTGASEIIAGLLAAASEG